MEPPGPGAAAYLLGAPLFLPSLPCAATLLGPLAPGKTVGVQGAVPAEAERFQVDFQRGCSVSPPADIGVRFNPRFRPRPRVICSSLSNGRWMAEKKFPNLPLGRGGAFQLLFLFEEDHVKVSVNGHHCLQYSFLLPLAEMNTIAISGDVIVKTIAFLPNNPFDASQAGYPHAQLPLMSSVTNLDKPLSYPLPNSLRPGDTITLRGVVREDPKGFCISLKKLGAAATAASAPSPLCTLWSFHVCFRSRTVSWSSSSDEGPSSRAELANCFPFHPQRYFELFFLCEEETLKLALNGTPLGQRPFPQLTGGPTVGLVLEGDVALYGVLTSSKQSSAGKV